MKMSKLPHFPHIIVRTRSALLLPEMRIIKIRQPVRISNSDCEEHQ